MLLQPTVAALVLPSAAESSGAGVAGKHRGVELHSLPPLPAGAATAAGMTACDAGAAAAAVRRELQAVAVAAFASAAGEADDEDASGSSGSDGDERGAVQLTLDDDACRAALHHREARRAIAAALPAEALRAAIAATLAAAVDVLASPEALLAATGSYPAASSGGAGGDEPGAPATAASAALAAWQAGRGGGTDAAGSLPASRAHWAIVRAAVSMLATGAAPSSGRAAADGDGNDSRTSSGGSSPSSSSWLSCLPASALGPLERSASQSSVFLRGYYRRVNAAEAVLSGAAEGGAPMATIPTALLLSAQMSGMTAEVDGAAATGAAGRRASLEAALLARLASQHVEDRSRASSFSAGVPFALEAKGGVHAVADSDAAGYGSGSEAGSSAEDGNDGDRDGERNLLPISVDVGDGLDAAVEFERAPSTDGGPRRSPRPPAATMLVDVARAGVRSAVLSVAVDVVAQRRSASRDAGVRAVAALPHSATDAAIAAEARRLRALEALVAIVLDAGARRAVAIVLGEVDADDAPAALALEHELRAADASAVASASASSAFVGAVGAPFAGAAGAGKTANPLAMTSRNPLAAGAPPADAAAVVAQQHATLAGMRALGRRAARAAAAAAALEANRRFRAAFTCGGRGGAGGGAAGSGKTSSSRDGSASNSRRGSGGASMADDSAAAVWHFCPLLPSADAPPAAPGPRSPQAPLLTNFIRARASAPGKRTGRRKVRGAADAGAAAASSAAAAAAFASLVGNKAAWRAAPMPVRITGNRFTAAPAATGGAASSPGPVPAGPWSPAALQSLRSAVAGKKARGGRIGGRGPPPGRSAAATHSSDDDKSDGGLEMNRLRRDLPDSPAAARV